MSTGSHLAGAAATSDRSTQSGDHGAVPAGPGSIHALLVMPHLRRDGFWASIGGHVLGLADPAAGPELAPTPNDLFVASLASDVAWSAQRFLRANGLPGDVTVSAKWLTREYPPRPADIALTVTVRRRAEAVSAPLAAAICNSLVASVHPTPVVEISYEP
jgi:uncharacterized OsmC-like protein